MALTFCFAHQGSTRDLNAPGLRLIRPSTTITPLGIDITRSDMQSFYTFRLHTAPRVSGFFNQSFWTVDLLQAAQYYPAVWHVSLCLSATQQWRERGRSESPQHYILSCKHYSEAIRRLLPVAAKANHDYNDMEMLLISEIMLAGTNALAGRFLQALAHSKNTLQLYNYWQLWKEPSPAYRGQGVLSIDVLRLLVANIQAQLCLRSRLAAAPHWGERGYPPPCSSKPYRTADDAYKEWQLLLTGMMFSLRDIGHVSSDELLPMVVPAVCYSTLIHEWSAKLDELARSGHLGKEKNRYQLRLLRMFEAVVKTCIDNDFSQGVFMLDRHRQTYAYILEELEDLCSLPDVQHSGLSFSQSVGESIWLCALNCRDSRHRQRAIGLLRRLRICDGLWDSMLLAEAMQKLKDVEDEGGLLNDGGLCLCVYQEYICGKHRIRESFIECVGQELIFCYNMATDAEGCNMRRISLQY